MRIRRRRRPGGVSTTGSEIIPGPGDGLTTSLPGWAIAGPAIVLLLSWAAPAAGQTDFELVCPCTVEAANLTSVSVHFGVRSLVDEGDSGPLAATLEGRRMGVGGFWQRLATVRLPAVAAGATVEPKNHTMPFRQRTAGTWELRLRLWGDGFRARDSIHWVSEPVDVTTGGGSFSSVYFDGTPTASIAGGNATLNLPAIRNAHGGTAESDLSVELVGTGSLEVNREHVAIATHDYNADLAADGEIAAAEVTVALGSTGSHDYLQLRIKNGDGETLAYETVAVPEGGSLPVRSIATADADILVDSDEDGVSDVNERLMATDPGDAESTPGDPTIDVLALYSPGFSETYDGDPSTRIRHVLTLADAIFGDSGVNAAFRLVGIAEIELDESHAFTETPAQRTRELIDLHGADVVVMFRSWDTNASLCGWAYVGGLLSRGTAVYDFAEQRVVHVFGECGSNTTAHEIGHLMGLGHSYEQDEVGTFRWSRGHGVPGEFVTVMAYPQAFGFAAKLDRFSDPDADCDGAPCGVAIDEPDGADAVTSLNATRFQVAGFEAARPDSDGDGFVDPVDAFPDDESEQFDFDGDGTGDNADTDDDNDGVADADDLFPFDDTEWADTDGDGVGDNGDAFPDDRFETLDTDGDGVGDNADRFPDDSTEWVDTDNDGVGNNSDAFPYDTRDWLDTDGDGTGDSLDTDDDNDGVADVNDHLPLDAARDRISSYRFVIAHGANQNRTLAPAGDIDGDGLGDFLIGLVHLDDAAQTWSSVAWLVAAADLSAADAADGVTDNSIDLASIADRSGSWKFVGEEADDRAGVSVASAGDLDGDGKDDVIIGATGHDGTGSLWNSGAAYVISAADLAAADAADGASDGVVNLAHIAGQPNSWKIVGEQANHHAGGSVGLAGDLDGDGAEELYVGARWAGDGRGALYVLSAARLSAADAADGTGDGVISLGRVAALPESWKLTGQDEYSQVGGVRSVPAADNAGNVALLVTAEGYRGDGESWIGAIYLASSADLASIDAADGDTDGVLELGRVAAGMNSWQFLGLPGDPIRSAVGLDDIDGDGIPDLFLESATQAFLISGADMADLDKDDDTDGIIRPHGLDAANSWQARGHFLRGSFAEAGRLDGDELRDLTLLNAEGGHLLAGADLAAAVGKSRRRFVDIPSRSRSWRAAVATGSGHGVLRLGLAGDTDGDGLDDALMFAEDRQAFLLSASDLRALDAADARSNGRIDLSQVAGDFDGDGVDNVIDDDDDNDGHDDADDVFPRDPTDWRDSDFDGVGDSSDAFPRDGAEHSDTDGDGIGDNADTDDDGDGVADIDDEYPLDTDDDGTDNALDDDDDGDGVGDASDAFPLDASESVDTDGDGTGDNADSDDDGDGTPDESDALPLDPHETADADGDGVGDNGDAFPFDATESVDTDRDGLGNEADSDDDGDGVGDASDAFPLDPEESADSDGDGIGNNADAFPYDANEWIDTDNDGTGNNADNDDDNDEHTDGADHFPLDSGRTRLFHYRLTGENARALAGVAMDAGDIEGNGFADVLIGAPGTTARLDLFFSPSYGAAYKLSGADFDEADRADGLADHVIRLDNVAPQTHSGAVSGESVGDEAGESVAILGDLGSDGRSEWLLGARFAGRNRGAAYLVSPADHQAADRDNGADGNARIQDVIARSDSWVFQGEESGARTGTSVARAGDVNGDGSTDFLIGAPRFGPDRRGAAYLVSGSGLGAADTNDAFLDGRIELAGNAGRDGSWTLTGEPGDSAAGRYVASAGDIDGDGMDDILIGAPYHSEAGRSGRGALYLIAAADLDAADKADDESDDGAGPEADGRIGLAHVSAQPASWKLVGEDAGDLAGWQALAADTDGDGNPELIVGAPGHQTSDGAVYVLPIASLAAADSADGNGDRVVNLGQVAALPNGYKFTGDDAAFGLFGRGSGAGGSLAAADLDGDGGAELLVGAEDYQEGAVWCPAPGEQRQSGAVYVISGLDFALADAADGASDGVARLAGVAGLPNSWQLLGEPTDRLGGSIAAGADLDGDNRADLVMGGPDQFVRYRACGESGGAGIAVVLSGADLAEADRRDGSEDGVVDFEALRRVNRSVDFDFDGTEDALDSDDDNDGVADTDDAFPLDPAESADNDHDGIGDNADPDDDNEGTPDGLDAFPFDPYETVDTDGDGTGDNADTDDDGDGAPDLEDAFPLDPSETADTDGDGIGDNADADPHNAVIDTDGDGTADSEDSDDDGDGVDDVDDLYPLDADRSDLYFFRIRGSAIALAGADFDGDGLGDLVARSANRVTYLVSSSDLDATDGADGAGDRVVDLDTDSVPARSWKLNAARHDRVFPAGDVDSDGKDDLIVNDLLVSASSLAAEDDAYAPAGDRLLRLSAVSAGRDDGIWRLEGSRLDWGVFSLADLDGDGRADLLIGSPLRIGEFEAGAGADAVYVASGADWQSADTLDGADDGDISLDELAKQPGSWKIESETDIAMGASIGSAGDVNGDGHSDLMIGAPGMPFGTNPDSGGVILLSGAAMDSLDAADGSSDGAIRISQGSQEGVWKLGGKDFDIGEIVSAAGDTDGDGLDDVLVNAASGAYLVTGASVMAGGGDPAVTGSRRFAWWRYGLGLGDLDGDGLSDLLLAGYYNTYLVSGRDLPGLGNADGTVNLTDFQVPARSWRIVFENADSEFQDTASLADLNGDGKPELILPARIHGNTNGEESGENASYIISLAELSMLDLQDGKGDGVIHIDLLERRWSE